MQLIATFKSKNEEISRLYHEVEKLKSQLANQLPLAQQFIRGLRGSFQLKSKKVSTHFANSPLKGSFSRAAAGTYIHKRREFSTSSSSFVRATAGSYVLPSRSFSPGKAQIDTQAQNVTKFVRAEPKSFTHRRRIFNKKES